jgi:hypothetical protein
VRPSSDIPGVEARAWFSRSQGRYYVQRWTDRGEAVDVWLAPEGEFGYPKTAPQLPEDAVEIGANPTEYELSFHKGAAEIQHGRALAAEGRIERVRQHLMRSMGLPNLPLESLVDTLAARAGLAPIPAVTPKRPPTFDVAMTRLGEIGGCEPTEISSWGRVHAALAAAAADRNERLHTEVVSLADIVGVQLRTQERTPVWLTD